MLVAFFYSICLSLRRINLLIILLITRTFFGGNAPPKVEDFRKISYLISTIILFFFCDFFVTGKYVFISTFLSVCVIYGVIEDIQAYICTVDQLGHLINISTWLLFSSCREENLNILNDNQIDIKTSPLYSVSFINHHIFHNCWSLEGRKKNLASFCVCYQAYQEFWPQINQYSLISNWSITKRDP